jgi:Holliday junction DNA helicase RuvA
LITSITGVLNQVEVDRATMQVGAFEYEVLIPEFTRRRIQLTVGQELKLITIDYLEGNPAQGGKLTPRLVGFTTEVEREFFEMFCSVDGVGVKKALRAMVRPVKDVATAIVEQDSETLVTLPGIGAATADRIIAKLKRKMAKFALMAIGDTPQHKIDRSVVDDAYSALRALGHAEAHARELLETAINKKKSYKDVEALLQAVYQQQQA